MKKILFLLMILIISLTFNIKSKAEYWWQQEPQYDLSIDVEYNITLAYSNYYVYNISIYDVNEYMNTHGVQLILPLWGDLSYNYGSIQAGVYFRDSNGNNILANNDLSYYKYENYDTNPSGKYFFNTLGVGSNPDNNYEVDSIQISIPLEGVTTQPPSSYYISLTQGTKANKVINGEVLYNTEWSLEYLMDNYRYINTEVLYDSSYNTSQIFIPTSDYHTNFYSSHYSKLEYYDNTNALICTYNLEDITNFNRIIDISPISNDCNIYVDQVEFIKIRILQKPFDITLNTTDYNEYLNNNTVIALNNPLYLANIYNGGYLINQKPFTVNNLTNTLLPYFNLPDFPQSPKEDLYFSGFLLSDGKEYKMNYEVDDLNNKVYFYGINEINPIFYTNNTVNLYAKFGLEGIENVVTPEKNADQKLVDVVNAFGFDTTLGYLLIYFLIIVLVNITLYLTFKNVLLILIIDLIVTGFFTYLGVFTILILVLLYATLAVLFINEIRKE